MDDFAASLGLFLVTLPIQLLNAFGYYKLFLKAGKPGWKAFVPFLNSLTVLEITGRKSTDVFLELIPIVNIFIYVRDTVELLRCFGEERPLHKTMAIALSWIYLPIFAHRPSVKYRGTLDSLPKVEHPKSVLREWADAIIFAVVAATLIRWLIMEAYTIPTPSMENSLLVGDFLFVSKFHYGTRTTTTPLQVPLTHQKIWFTEIPSYLKWIQLPQYRLPGITKVKREDVVVFNVPPASLNEGKDYPVDLKTNYIKRCVAIPGDTLMIKDRQVYINGKPEENPPLMQYSYTVVTNEEINERILKKYKIYDYDMGRTADGVVYQMFLTPDLAEELRKLNFVREVRIDSRPEKQPDSNIFPSARKFPWNADYFGPLVIPAKGMTIPINEQTLATYGSTIRLYDHNNNVKIDSSKLTIDGKEITEYTFKQNYYFMMGDNRHNSLDSRYWGFVPEDHIVGKAFFIWLSIDRNADFVHKIRWNRFFKVIE